MTCCSQFTKEMPISKQRNKNKSISLKLIRSTPGQKMSGKVHKERLWKTFRKKKTVWELLKECLAPWKENIETIYQKFHTVRIPHYSCSNIKWLFFMNWILFKFSPLLSFTFLSLKFLTLFLLVSFQLLFSPSLVILSLFISLWPFSWFIFFSYYSAALFLASLCLMTSQFPPNRESTL